MIQITVSIIISITRVHMKINGKVVIVTGASSGIGRATAELFGKNGAKIALAAAIN